MHDFVVRKSLVIHARFISYLYVIHSFFIRDSFIIYTRFMCDSLVIYTRFMHDSFVLCVDLTQIIRAFQLFICGNSDKFGLDVGVNVDLHVFCMVSSYSFRGFNVVHS